MLEPKGRVSRYIFNTVYITAYDDGEGVNLQIEITLLKLKRGEDVKNM